MVMVHGVVSRLGRGGGGGYVVIVIVIFKKSIDLKCCSSDLVGFLGAIVSLYTIYGVDVGVGVMGYDGVPYNEMARSM